MHAAGPHTGLLGLGLGLVQLVLTCLEVLDKEPHQLSIFDKTSSLFPKGD